MSKNDFSFDCFTDLDLRILLEDGKTMSQRFYREVKEELKYREFLTRQLTLVPVETR